MKDRFIILLLLLALVAQQVAVAGMMTSMSMDMLSVPHSAEGPGAEHSKAAHPQPETSGLDSSAPGNGCGGGTPTEASMDCCASDCINCDANCQYVIPAPALRVEPLLINAYHPVRHCQLLTPLPGLPFKPPIVA